MKKAAEWSGVVCVCIFGDGDVECEIGWGDQVVDARLKMSYNQFTFCSHIMLLCHNACWECEL